jgi:hypothetical protein
MTSAFPSEIEEEMEQILRAAGIESCPVDPSSISHLRQLVMDRKIGKQAVQEPIAKKPPPVAVERSAAVPTQATDRTQAVNSSSDKYLQAPIRGNASQDGAILHELKLQSELMVGLKEQIERLTEKVERLEQGGETAHNKSKIKVISTTRFFSRKTNTTTQPPSTEVPDVATNTEPPVAENNNVIHNNLVAEEKPPRGVFGCLIEIARLFWTERRDHVRQLDGALLFKLILMLVVVSTRLSRQANATDKNIKMVSMLFAVGVLYHTRYLQYIYQFFWKEEVPRLVWNGQDNIALPPPQADDALNRNNEQARQPNPARRLLRGNWVQLVEEEARQPNPAPPRLRLREQQEEEHGNWWRNGFLAGGIAPGNNIEDVENENYNPIIGFGQDIFYLLGSFVFSIFPMWNPEGLQQQIRQNQLEGQHHQHDVAEPNNQGIPAVQPPADDGGDGGDD